MWSRLGLASLHDRAQGNGPKCCLRALSLCAAVGHGTSCSNHLRAGHDVFSCQSCLSVYGKLWQRIHRAGKGRNLVLLYN